ncbi:MAG: SH3 domain-containing protein [Eubacterium sp.]|nr:SH3 domain-containing protein [Eubacterium sp.]MDD7209358.1 SH3 domain-containing protein [Lachnospiraceae bacterium]MDY5497575.1 SH3 domain-containing protein [Anaerobutyricum sp.]
MFKKIIVSFFCAILIAGMVCAGVGLLYFLIPSRKAQASISLPSIVEDKDSSQDTSAKKEDSEEDDIYVADVYQSLTLRAQAGSDSEAITGLSPMTRVRVLEFVAGTDYAHVEVISGESKGYKGYVNNEYITKLGEPTVRIRTEE